MAVAGGAMIGVSVSLMLYFNGKVIGISSIIGNLLPGARDDGSRWRLLVLLGLIAGGAVMLRVNPASFSPRGMPGTGLVVLAGLLVGVGTRMSRGCTSGHGVCGLGRMSARSIAATTMFIATGMVAVAVLRFLGVRP